MNLVVSPEAVADLERLRAFLREKNEKAGRRATAALIEAIQSLDTFPDRGRPSGIEHVRELIVPFGRSAYVLRYLHQPQSQEVVVLRIWHGRERRE